MKEKIIGSLILLVVCIAADLAAKFAFDFFETHHIDLIKPMFVGLGVGCIMSLFKRKTMPILPIWLGVGSFIGEIIIQFAH